MAYLGKLTVQESLLDAHRGFLLSHLKHKDLHPLYIFTVIADSLSYSNNHLILFF